MTAHACTFCGAFRDDVRALVDAPGDLAICDACIARAVSAPRDVAGMSDRSCAYCMGREPVHAAVAATGVMVCEECLPLCVEILRRDGAGVAR